MTKNEMVAESKVENHEVEGTPDTVNQDHGNFSEDLVVIVPEIEEELNEEAAEIWSTEMEAMFQRQVELRRSHISAGKVDKAVLLKEEEDYKELEDICNSDSESPNLGNVPGSSNLNAGYDNLENSSGYVSRESGCDNLNICSGTANPQMALPIRLGEARKISCQKGSILETDLQNDNGDSNKPSRSNSLEYFEQEDEVENTFFQKEDQVMEIPTATLHTNYDAKRSSMVERQIGYTFQAAQPGKETVTKLAQDEKAEIELNYAEWFNQSSREVN